jgi:hypothetical protein
MCLRVSHVSHVSHALGGAASRCQVDRPGALRKESM